MSTQNPNTETTPDDPPQKKRWKINWKKVCIFTNLAILAVVACAVAGMEVIHQSDTNPNFCSSCHLMESHVTSYLEGDNLDHIHAGAGVQCKDCHSDYSVLDEIRSGFNFIRTNYETGEDGELLQRDFGDEICTQCHGSRANVEIQTDYLYYNPHFTRMGIFSCNTCHLSHGEQIDYCSECHPNGGQRMIGDTTPRSEMLGQDIKVYR